MRAIIRSQAVVVPLDREQSEAFYVQVPVIISDWLAR